MTRPMPHAANVEQAAALWYARMASELKTPADQAEFDAWLRENPEHGEAYAEFCALDSRFDMLEGRPELATYRVEAQLVEESARRSFLSRFGKRLAAAMVASAAILLAFVYLDSFSMERQEWATARGEVRQIVLSDGTRAILGADTQARMAFDGRQRRFIIEHGQVFFDVAHDIRRPFIAVTPERTVTALGTAFDVRSFQNDLTVTLVRGRVAVAALGRTPDALLDPGQQFRASFGVTSVRDVDAEAEVSWQTGIFDFDNIPLSEAVARFNRSATRTIVLADPSLGEFRVSGVFSANDPAGFARALAPAYPVLVQQQTSGDIVLARRD